MGASPSCGSTNRLPADPGLSGDAVTCRFAFAQEDAARQNNRNNPKTSQNRVPGTARWGPAPLAVPR